MNHRSVVICALISLGGAGCHSIHSSAVRTLIDRESDKIAQGLGGADNFIDATEGRISALEGAIADADSTYRTLQTNESVDTIIYGANSSVAAMRDVDARAIATLAGRSYFDAQMGMESAVRQQFADDIEALRNASAKLKASWEAVSVAHGTIAEFARKSGLASIDTAALRAAVGESKEASRLLDRAIEQGSRISDALSRLHVDGKAPQYIDELLAILKGATAAAPPEPIAPPPPAAPISTPN